MHLTPEQEIDVVHVSVEREISTMEEIARLLERLDRPAQRRVINWTRERYLFGCDEDF